MSELLPHPDPTKFPNLSADPAWIRDVQAGTMLTRIYRAGGAHPVEWHSFREYGPLDGRFDPHPEPIGEHPGEGVLYTVLESRTRQTEQESSGEPADPVEDAVSGPFAAAVLEVFQAQRMIRRSAGGPVLALFETVRPLRLLDLADSDWVSVAQGNGAISAGDRARSREWARAIRASYPEIDGLVSTSSLVPSARLATLWEPARTAMPDHPLALLPLERDELTGVIDAIADRYGYILV